MKDLINAFIDLPAFYHAAGFKVRFFTDAPKELNLEFYLEMNDDVWIAVRISYSQ